MASFTGIVKGGTGAASERSLPDLDRLEELVGFRPVPGTLNVALSRPIMLMGFTYHMRATNTLIYGVPGRVNGINAAIVKTPGARAYQRLHDIEVFAPVHLRSTFGLSDGQRVTVVIDEAYLGRVEPITWLRWWTCNSNAGATLKVIARRLYRALHRVANIPRHLRPRSTYHGIRHVANGLIAASREALSISRSLSSIQAQHEHAQGIAVINAGRCLPITDIELYMARILAGNGLTVYVLVDDGVLEHWDSAQEHDLKYYSPYRARWFIRWRYAVRKHLIWLVYRRRGMKLLNYSAIASKVQPSAASEPADREYAINSTERFYETSLVDVEGAHRDYYQKSLRNCAVSRSVAKYVLDTLHPDLFITSHGIYSTWGPAYRSMREAGVPIVVWQVAGTTTGKIRLVDRHDQVLASTSDWREFDAATPLDSHILQEGSALIEARIAHRTQDTEEYFAPSAHVRALHELGGGEGGVRFGMFPNVVWDGNVPERNIMFENVVEWCEFTINAIRGTRHHLYVRFHPSETTRLNGSVRLEDVVRQRIPDLDRLGNITLISSSEPVDTYQLARTHVDIGLIYDGTLCVELTYMGIPVIACTNGNFTPDTIVYKPQSNDEYGGYLREPNGILDRFEQEWSRRTSQACKYAYWLFEASLFEFQPLVKPYAGSVDYRLVGRDELLSRDERRIRDRLLRPLKEWSASCAEGAKA